MLEPESGCARHKSVSNVTWLYLTTTRLTISHWPSNSQSIQFSVPLQVSNQIHGIPYGNVLASAQKQQTTTSSLVIAPELLPQKLK